MVTRFKRRNKNKNAKQIQAGREKIVGIAATTLGIEYYINQNNEELGVHLKMQLLVILTQMAKSSNKIFTAPLIMETIEVRGQTR